MSGGRYEKLASLRELLKAHTVADFPTQPSILEIPDNMEPQEAFTHIVENGFLSAPVINAAALEDPSVKPVYAGFLDTRGLVAWVVFAADEDNVTPSLKDILHYGIKRVAKAITAVTVVYMAKFNPLKPVTNKDTVFHLCEVLSLRGVHRLPVLNPATGRVEKIISQSSVISWLYKHSESLGDVMSRTVEDLKLGHSPVVSVPATTSAIDVFKKMEKSNLSGIAVVNEEGRIIGSTSGSDLKLYLKMPEPESLKTSIMTFLNKLRQESLRAKVPVLVCTPTDTLGKIISKLAATKEHRIFVVESDKTFKPASVISLSDILKAVVTPPEEK